MPRVTVFTPSHRVDHLDDCLRSMLAQTFADWEWIVLLNGSAGDWPGSADPRLRVLRASADVRGVGAAKRAACAAASGDLLVELDHDDVLASDALAHVVAAFDAAPDAGLVYSDMAQVLGDLEPDPETFLPSHGWRQTDTDVDGRSVRRIHTMEPFPHNVSTIWYAPNHVRAFRRSTYEAVGGYDAGRDVLDDQDLMCRLYQRAPFAYVDRCLYLQRVHEHNTQRDAVLNPRIQTETIELYDQHVEANALAWARREGRRAVDLGRPDQIADGYEAAAFADGRLPFDGDEVGVVRAVDVLQRQRDPVTVMNELHRVLAHGGMALTMTPSTDGRGAFQDPGHVSYWNENSFWYATDRHFAAYVEGSSCRFHRSRLRTWFPGDWYREHDIPYVQANLVALKDGPVMGGEQRW